MTRTYARDVATYTQAEIDAAVAAGTAQLFPTTAGPIYVLKVAGRSIKVTDAQIVKAAPLMGWEQTLVDADNAAEAWLADQDAAPLVETVYSVPAADETLIAEADTLGISVDELTDGEYRDPRDARKTKAEQLDEIAAFFL